MARFERQATTGPGWAPAQRTRSGVPVMGGTVRRWLKRLFIALGVVGMLGLAALVALVVWEWTYISRLRHHPENLITEVAWYAPREPVPGGGGAPLPRATPAETRVSDPALEEVA